MLRNYIKIAWRNIVRAKAYSALHILGLAIGLSSVIFIAMYIQHELSFDKGFKDASQIYRVNINGKMGDNSFFAGYTPPPAGTTLVENFPEIESATRIYRPGDATIESSENGIKQVYNEKEVYAVDPNFLEVLRYPLQLGEAKNCFKSPNSVVITPQIARKYFGDTNPLGKTLFYGPEKQPLEVTGVLEDLQDQAVSVKFDLLVPISNFSEVDYFNWSWVWLNVATYVKLNPDAANDKGVSQLEAQFPEMLKVQAAAGFKRIGQPYEEFLAKGNYWDLHLQSLDKIHLYSDGITSSITNQQDAQNLYILGIIAVFIVVLACVNFMNLASAQATKRSKEIGIRKVLGSARPQLIKQFMMEAFCYAAIAGMVAIGLVVFALPVFNSSLGLSLQLSSLFGLEFIALILGLVVLTAFLAGIYPAFFITSFNTVHALKGKTAASGKNGFVRNGLVIFQFSIAIALIICTLVVFSQLRYTQNKDLGYDQENLVVINNTERLQNSEKSFRQELSEMPEVLSATQSSSVITKGEFGDFYVPKATETDPDVAKDIVLSSYLVDDYFINTLDLKLMKGRGFQKEFKDSLSVVINETAARQIGWSEPLGQQIRYPGGNYEYYTVVGVVKDFNLESLHNSIQPFALFSEGSKSYDTGTSYITVKLDATNPKPVLEAIQQKWKTYIQDVPFEYSFLDDDLQLAYQEDALLASLFSIFTGLALFVACLGLFGLTAFRAEQRRKEIGVRKVLGSSVSGIVRLLSKDFIRLVILSILVAAPMGWWLMHQWLQGFAYRTEIDWGIIVLAAASAILIAVVTVSIQAIRAATANPIKSLRTE